MISKILQISPYFELRYEQINTAFGLHERVIKQAIGISSSLDDLLKREYEQLLELDARIYQNTSIYDLNRSLEQKLIEQKLRFNQAIGYVSNRLILTYIKGQSFHEYLKGAYTWSFPKKLKLSIDLTRQIDHLHDLGFVHLDLSPSNLMCDQQDLIWLIDWMSAVDLTQKTVDILAVAKVKYSHPKDWHILIQQRNQAHLEVDRQTLNSKLRQRLIKRDQFALYCILYEIWLNQPLFFMSQAQLFEYQKLSFLKDSDAIDQFQRWGENCLRSVQSLKVGEKIRKMLNQMKISLIEEGEIKELLQFFERVHSQDL
jgi:tRNA A-37 threonylcarbamoyl transferase component Bud32